MKQDFIKAKEYFEKAARLGHPDAIYNIGQLYENCQGMKQDTDTAIKYYIRAAKRVNPDALFILAFLFENGEYLV